MSFIDHLKGLNNGVRFAGEDIREWRKPIVYLFIKDGLPLYVGFSRKGIARIFGKHHKPQAQAECDEVMVWPVESIGDALRLEQVLIFHLKPSMNKRGGLMYAEVPKQLGVSKRRAYELRKRSA